MLKRYERTCWHGTRIDQYMQVNTHYYCSNLIWRTVSRRVDELLSSDHTRREASSVIRRYQLIHETWSVHQIKLLQVMLFLLYTLSLVFAHKFTQFTPKRANYWRYVSDKDVISGRSHSFGSIAQKWSLLTSLQNQGTCVS